MTATIKELILSAIANGHTSMEGISDFCEGIYPPELEIVLSELVLKGHIIKADQNHYVPVKSVRRLALKRKEQQLPPLPHPHPLDYDWRFSHMSIDSLCTELMSLCHSSSTLLLVGCPSIWLGMQQFEEPPKMILIDQNHAMISTLKQYSSNPGTNFICHNLLLHPLENLRSCADIVVADPPWYLEHYRAFMLQAAISVQHMGHVYISLLPSNTRPDADDDRWSILEYARNLGFTLQSLQPKQLAYESPVFELASLQQTNTKLSKTWRKGDLLLFRRTKELSSSQNYFEKVHDSLENDWAEVTIGRNKIKLRGPFDDFVTAPDIASIEENDILASVSRRYEKRSQVDLWLWDNRVFKVDGRTALRNALYIRAGKMLPNEISQLSKQHLHKAQELLDSILGPTPILLTLKQVLENMVDEVAKLTITDLTKLCREYGIRGHLAILSQPYLDKILAGEKTIESRFSQNKVPPYQKISSGDILFLKETAGLVKAIVQVQGAEFVGPMNPGEAEVVIDQYSKELCIETDFRAVKKDSRYATLMYIGNMILVNPFQLDKSDRRSWVILDDNRQLSLF